MKDGRRFAANECEQLTNVNPTPRPDAKPRMDRRSLQPHCMHQHLFNPTFGFLMNRPALPIALCILAHLFLFVPSIVSAEESTTAKTPSYYNDVRPIFQANCQGCHQPAKASGDYVMTSFAAMLKGGESEETAIVPGKPDASHLIEEITPEDGAAEMPKNAKPLSDVEIETITNWIAAGAVDDTPDGAATAYSMENPPVYNSLPIVTSLDFSPDGELLAVSGFHEVLIHKSDGSELVARLVGLSERVQDVAFSPDGSMLAVAGGNPARMGEVQVWNVAERELFASVPATYDTVFGVSWSPDNKFVAFGCTDNSLRAIDVESGKQVLLQRAPNDWTLDTVFSKDGSHVVSVGRDMAVKLTHFETERFIDNITSITPGALKGGLTAVDRHPERDEIIVGGDDGIPRAYRMFRKTNRVIGDDSNLIRQFPTMDGRIFDIAYSKDGKRVVAGTSLNGKGQVFVYDCKYDFELPEEISKIEQKAVGGRNGDEKKKLAEFRKKDVTVHAKMEGQHGAVYAVAYHPNMKTVASSGYDGLIRLNDVDSGELTKEFAPVPQ